MSTLPSQMTAIAIREPGGPDVLVPQTRPVPAAGTGEGLVRVAAAGVNRPDVMQRQGLYPPPPGASEIPGLEIAGRVVALGNGATRFKPGDEITGLVAGGDYIERNYEAAAIEGRIVQIAFQGSPRANVDFRRLMLKRLVHTGSTLRARSVADKAAIAQGIEQKVWPLIAAGKVKPVVFRTFPLAEASAAHSLMETSTHIGKIVLTTDGG